MGKLCGTVIGLGLAGAIIGMHLYMCMPDKDQKHISRSLRNTVDDLKDIADRIAQ